MNFPVFLKKRKENEERGKRILRKTKAGIKVARP
jgi:hypothetical protein